MGGWINIWLLMVEGREACLADNGEEGICKIVESANKCLLEFQNSELHPCKTDISNHLQQARQPGRKCAPKIKVHCVELIGRNHKVSYDGFLHYKFLMSLCRCRYANPTVGSEIPRNVRTCRVLTAGSSMSSKGFRTPGARIKCSRVNWSGTPEICMLNLLGSSYTSLKL